MKKLKKFLFATFTVAILSCLLCQPAFAAISESDVQAQVDAVGKEAVSGNVFIWFLCAIGFLKVGQKIDSFLSSLGVNVGHTGGSMLAEAMIAAKGIGGIKNFSSHHFGGGRNSSSTNVNTNGDKGSGGFGAGFASGGLAGVVSRKVTNSAIKTATTTPGSKPSGLGSLLGDAAAGGIGGHMYASSVSKGGNFANNVIGSVAVSSKSKQLGTWRISNYTPEFRETSGVGKRPVLTPDEVLRLPLDQALIIIRGKKVLQVDKMDYSKHPEAKYLRSCKASAHVPEWRRLEEEAAKTPQPAPKPAPAAKKPAKRKATKPASPTDKSPKEAPAPKSAGTPEGIITTDKDSILS